MTPWARNKGQWGRSCSAGTLPRQESQSCVHTRDRPARSLQKDAWGAPLPRPVGAGQHWQGRETGGSLVSPGLRFSPWEPLGPRLVTCACLDSPRRHQEAPYTEVVTRAAGPALTLGDHPLSQPDLGRILKHPTPKRCQR